MCCGCCWAHLECCVGGEIFFKNSRELPNSILSVTVRPSPPNHPSRLLRSVPRLRPGTMAPAAEASAAPPTSEMSDLSLVTPAVAAASSATAPKGTAKRDALCASELEVQAMWEREKAFECDPDQSDGKEKFMVTFPYPYSNGHLHLGHAFSLTKAVFRSPFERNRGKNSLFPFAFHCTGMPIQAVSC